MCPVSATKVTNQMTTEPSDLEGRCNLLRSLHTPGAPLVLPNAWDVASARAVEAAGFPVIARRTAASPPHSATRITSMPAP
jgi:Phosphoenolpyruvate phosphomutase